MRFVNDLRLITSAVSLGHDETLIAYERYPEARAAVFAPPFRDNGLFLLAVGLESADDLAADLDAGLTTASRWCRDSDAACSRCRSSRSRAGAGT